MSARRNFAAEPMALLLEDSARDDSWRDAIFHPTGAKGVVDFKPLAARTFRARVHRDFADVKALWLRLQADGVATAYQRYDWITCLAEHRAAGSGASPLFVEVIEATTNVSVMLLPLLMRRQTFLRRITWFDLDVCDYAAPLMADGVSLSREEAGYAWTAVRAALPKSDLIDVRQIPPDIDGRINPLASLGACKPMELQAFGLGISGDPKTLLSRVMAPKDYRDLAKRRRRLERRGDVRLLEATGENDLVSMFQTMLDQRQKRFQRLGRFDLLAKPDVVAFYLTAARRSLGGRGPARLFGLAVDDEWVSMACLLVHSGVAHGIILTIAGDEWNNCSPGLLMSAALLEWARANDYHYFDMTVGNLPYKADLGATPRNLVHLLEARTMSGRLAKAMMLMGTTLAAHVRGRPRLFGRLRTLRRGLRRVVAWA